MANPVKGEASVTLASGEELTLRYDFNALAAVEEAADKPIAEVLGAMSNGVPRLTVARALIYGGLREHHPEVDVKAAGELVLSDGKALVDAMRKALASAFPQAEGRKGGNPPKSKTATTT